MNVDLTQVSTADLYAELLRREGVYEIAQLGDEDDYMYYEIVWPSSEREGTITGPVRVLVNAD